MANSGSSWAAGRVSHVFSLAEGWSLAKRKVLYLAPWQFTPVRGVDLEMWRLEDFKHRKRSYKESSGEIWDMKNVNPCHFLKCLWRLGPS